MRECLEHLIIGEANDRVASRFQVSRAGRIAGSLLKIFMDHAIDFDDQSVLWAVQIEYERSERVLTPEAQAIELPVA